MERVNDLLRRKKSKIIIFMILDIISMLIASYLALALRFDFDEIPAQYLTTAYKYVAIDIAVMLITFFELNLYTSVWRYASITELINIGSACFTTEIINLIYKKMFSISMPRSYSLIRLLLLIFFVATIRFSFRILRTITIKFENKKNNNNVMIVGGGEAARLLIDEAARNRTLFGSNIVCIIDDNKEKVGTYIRGIQIVGTRKQIKQMAEKYDVNEIIIAIPSASKEEISKIITECQKTSCELKILPSIFLTMNGKNNNIVNKIRPISYEDFLGRSQIVVDINEISNNIKDKVIMVTGGGGSIGSELCRQIAKCNPKQLIIFDIYENNAYEIQMELLRNYPNLDLHTIIGSVRDYDRLEKVFQKYKINQVFHAAAHKHVPLMEESPNEAIKNNCLGTLNCAKLADKYKVEKFVLISTDKAVRPTNVMGASKRICEMIIQSYDKISKNTSYVAVRFGNVLGSNGSVIPLFLKQIENGGPVTVTHKEITRFFMTIPEAVSLVLQASVYAKAGEIFVLDMGQPVKIYDLAKQIIRYKGFTPNEDIKIKITGLRPGEKLYEEILMDEEGLKETPNKLIHIGQPIEIKENFLEELNNLIMDSYDNNEDIKEKIAKIVTTYKIDNGKNHNENIQEEKKKIMA
jgi:FlaA1/EpsC-like NDP-sugar epimerase